MGDLKAELSKIRGKVKSSGNEPTRPDLREEPHRKPSRTQISTMRQSDDGVKSRGMPARVREVLECMPKIGKVRELQIERGFGFVEYDQGRVLFHVVNRSDRHNRVLEESLHAQLIHFALGTSPRSREKRPQAILWRPFRDSGIDIESVTHPQQSFDKYRRVWMESLDLSEIQEILSAEWYRELWRPHAVPVDLEDTLLENDIIRRLSALPEDSFSSSGLCKVLVRSPYSFAAQWSGRSEWSGSLRILRDLPVSKLVALDCLNPIWLDKLTSENLVKAGEWALRQPDEKIRREYLEHLRGDTAEEGRLARRLLLDGWNPEGAEFDWLAQLKASSQLDSSTIQQVLDNNPIQWKKWFLLLDPEITLQVYRGRFCSRPELVEFLSSQSSQVALEALSCNAVSIDLETDGETIREIGLSRWGNEPEVYRDVDGELAAGEAALRDALVGATLIVGHNVSEWDLPIIERQLGIKPSGLVWDTLMIQGIITPWSATHALGGTHSAGDDARQTMLLFREQLQELSKQTMLEILADNALTSTALISLITQDIIKSGWDLPELPKEIENAVSASRQGVGIITTPYNLRRFDWVSRVAVVAAVEEEVLDLTLWTVSPKMLEETDGQGASPLKLEVILGILRIAESQDITVRYDMFPLWLRDHPDADLDKRLREARTLPQRSRNGWSYISPLPRRASMLARCVPSQGWIILGAPVQKLVTAISGLTTNELSSFAKQSIGLPASEIANGLKGLYRGTDPDRLSTFWFYPDRVSQRIKSSSGFIECLEAVSAKSLSLQWMELPDASMPLEVMLPQSETVSLYPNSLDSQAYWIDLLGRFSRMLSLKPKGSVPILLIGSTRCEALRSLVISGLVELGIVEIPQDHHGRSERLRRSFKRDLCLVEFVDAWGEWRDISLHLGIPLAPYLEALPLERFLAESHDLQTDASDSSAKDSMSSLSDELDVEEGLTIEEDGILPAPVTMAGEASDEWVSNRTLLEATPGLLRNRMFAWLMEEGLVGKTNTWLVVLDARVSEIAGRLKNIVKIVQGKAEPISQDAQARLRANFDALGVLREEAPSSLDELQTFLVQHWNDGRIKGDPNYIPGFREKTQLPAIEGIKSRTSHVVVSLPTGEGKSVLFQVPALARGLRNRRLTLVLSPLKALMKDQFEGLERLGFGPSVGYLSSDQTPAEISETLQGILEHRIIMLYVAPERFRNPRFFDVIQRRALIDEGLEYVVFDEAHCISQWGYEFRPDYFYALQILKDNLRAIDIRNPTPFLFFSATLTQNDRDSLGRLMDVDEHSQGSGYLPLKFLPEAFNDPIRDFIELIPRQAQGGFSRWMEFEKEVETRLEIIAEECRSMENNRKQTGHHSSMIIFVGRRYHAEMLAAMVEQKTGLTCAFYHAGIDDEDRSDVYAGFQQGSIDVLVATKAFGMGMDIPHIHWSIHLSPPAYLEDYLQEVGRIGRGKGERDNARMKKLKAVLIWSSDDFATNRELRARGVITFNRVRDWLGRIQEASRDVSPGQALAVVPESGFEPQANEAKTRAVSTEIRMCLFWLEKAGKLEIAGSIPGILPATISLKKLRLLSEEHGTPIGTVSALILQAHDIQGKDLPIEHQVEPSVTRSGKRLNPTDRPTGFLSGLIGVLSSVVGIFLSRENSVASIAHGEKQEDSLPDAISKKSTERQDDIESLINLGQLLTDGRLETADKALETIAQIEELGGLRIQRKLSIKSMELSGAALSRLTSLLKAMEKIGSYLISETGQRGNMVLDWENISLRYHEYEIEPGADDNWTKNFKSGLRTALRFAGMRIHQRRQPDGTIREVAQLPRARVKTANSVLARTLAVSSEVLNKFYDSLNETNPQIELGNLVRAAALASPGRKFDKSLLWKALRVLSATKVLSAPLELLPRSYLLLLNQNGEEFTESEFAECREELKQVNELSEQRIHCMEVYANLPVDVQLPFIREYFKASGAEGLRQVMEGMLLEIESEAEVSDWIDSIRDSIREKSATEAMQKFKKDPEEPNQWAAIVRPFSRSILVNAGPGSGKTAVLLARVFHLIREQGLLPEQILVLAFNRAVVFELRSRLQELFRSLGYPRYVRRLQIHTFHGFALRSLPKPEDGDWKTHRENLLGSFASSLNNELYARDVASGYRAILVDEFQDVDEEIFSILTMLKNAAGKDAGIFAIGDDDQDILRWKRRKESPYAEFSDFYFKRYIDQFEVDEQDRFALSVNFRSGSSIVERSQNFIGTFFEQSKSRSRRMKTVKLMARRSADEGLVEIDRLDADRLQDMPYLAYEFCRTELSKDNIKTVAILARSNTEVAEIYLNLKKEIPNVTLQTNIRHRLSDLRHLGALTDILRDHESAAGNLYLTDELVHNLCVEFERTDVAEARFPRSEDLSVSTVFDLSRKEFPRPSLRNVIELLESSTLDEAERIIGLRSGTEKFAVVSTIHKVKGLEFDSVFIASSGMNLLVDYGNSGREGLTDLAAEEARLYYVGMTRAKKRLKFHFGPREKAWWHSSNYEGIQINQHLLTGSYEDVVVSWAMQENRFNPNGDACQDYIEKEVRVGDLIILGGTGMGSGRALIHRSGSGNAQQVGFLANKAGTGGADSHLMVTAVVRTRLDEDSVRGDQWGVPSRMVKERGWGYTVLVAGILANG